MFALQICIAANLRFYILSSSDFLLIFYRIFEDFLTFILSFYFIFSFILVFRFFLLSLRQKLVDMKYFSKGRFRNFEWEGEVHTLCFYRNANGVRFWVGESKEGYFYGTAHHVVATHSLCHCFRWAVPFSTKEEAIKNTDLRVCRGEPVPDDIRCKIAEAALTFSSPAFKRYKKENDLPFEL